VGSGAGIKRFGKFRPPPGFDPRSFQPVLYIHMDKLLLLITGMTQAHAESRISTEVVTEIHGRTNEWWFFLYMDKKKSACADELRKNV
jgi:hypothetical protein